MLDHQAVTPEQTDRIYSDHILEIYTTPNIFNLFSFFETFQNLGSFTFMHIPFMHCLSIWVWAVNSSTFTLEVLQKTKVFTENCNLRNIPEVELDTIQNNLLGL